MEQELRNALRRTVVALREQLVASAEEQLESRYGILPRDGRVLPVDAVPPLQESAELRRRRKEILQEVEHEKHHASGSKPSARALETFILKAAFTQLNRLAALKVLERRNLVPKCLSQGTNSSGFRLFRQVETSVARTEGDGGYRAFLELLFDDCASEIRLLFDRTLPSSYLFPSPDRLRDVLALVNADEISKAWDEDEVLGWVYQYFTPTELREQVRSESRAPRNAAELVIRNQFYTPDYVVRFLAENTLGRLWWEVHPETLIANRDFLVYRQGETGERRGLNDPRDLRILDPACGSGHFLHYCFDLLETIYREAYNGHTAGAGLRKEYPDRAAFERAIPELILAHNLYGIDIDLRAVQLTALSLLLRAKSSHPEARIRRVNAIHAAPMPGDKALFEEFLASLGAEPNGELLQSLLRDIWRELNMLAGEAGPLLRAERAIRRRMEELKADVEQASVRQLGLTELLGPSFEQAELNIDSIPTAEFWSNLEERIVELLRNYAARAESHGVARRLFADDAHHGIAFLDALLQEYDVVLMNPPFGAASAPSKRYIDRSYPRTKRDVYAVFVERGLQLLRPRGYLGAITSRTGFFLTSFQAWREEILLKETEIIAFADLGHGVLDTAMVETAAYALRKSA